MLGRKLEVHITLGQKSLTMPGFARIMYGVSQAKSWAGVDDSGSGRNHWSCSFHRLRAGVVGQLLDLVGKISELGGHNSHKLVLVLS